MIAPLVLMAVMVASGITLAAALPMTATPLSLGIGMGIGVFAGLLAALVRASRLSLLALCALGLCVGWCRAVIDATRPAHHVASVLSNEPAPVAIHGLVTRDPTELFSPGEPDRHVAVVAVRHLRHAGRWQPMVGALRVRLRFPRVRLAYGDEVLLEGRVSTVPPPSNPGHYDWRAALAREHIDGLMQVESHDAVVRLRQGHGWWAMRAIGTVRDRIDEVIRTTFARSHADLLRSFLLGQRTQLDESLKQAFVKTGTMHLVVVSGFNVGLIVVVCELALRLLGLPWSLRLLLNAIGVGGYCLLTGMQPPVMRATLMAWVVLGARALDRVIHWPTALAAAALAILLVNPRQLSDPGFQLSFGAVASLLVLMSRLQRRIEPRLSRGPAWLRRYVALSLASTLAIWIGIWPLLAWYFHLVSPISMAANLVLVPLVSLLVAVGTVILLVGAMIPTVVSWAHGTLVMVLEAVMACVRFFERVPGGSWTVGHPSWWLIGGYYLLLVASLARHQLRLRPAWVVGMWAAGLNLALWGAVVGNWHERRWLTVTMLDVGHGDGLVMQTASRRTWLVDAGTPEAGEYTVVPYLRFCGIRTVEALVLTHPDEDHIGGALAVLRELRVRRLISNGALGTSRTGRRILQFLQTHRIPHTVAHAGMQLRGLLETNIEVLHPPASLVPGMPPDANENSLVLKVTKGEISLLLCGDLEEGAISGILAWEQTLASTVLKVPHHGSALGPRELEFFSRVQPQWSVISVGRLHHLPAAGVLDHLRQVGSRVVLTREAGAVTIRTDGAHVAVTPFKRDE